MTARIIDRAALSQRIREDVAPRVAALAAKGTRPGLAVVLVGEDTASQVYVRNKERACRQLGMDSILLRLPETTSQEELIRRVDELNAVSYTHLDVYKRQALDFVLRKALSRGARHRG